MAGQLPLPRPAFSLFGLPRCGTAWASLWLGARHDPWAHSRPQDHPEGVGICCTGSWLYRGLLEAWEGVPRVYLDRNPDEVNRSLRAIGLRGLPDAAYEYYRRLPGIHFNWTSLWTNPAAIWRGLKPTTPFDPKRHDLLTGVNIQTRVFDADPTILAELEQFR